MGIFSECEYFFKANLYNLIHKMTQNHTLPVDMTTATFQQFSSSSSCMYHLTDTVCTFLSTLYYYNNYVSSSWSKLAGYCSNKITFQESDRVFLISTGWYNWKCVRFCFASTLALPSLSHLWCPAKHKAHDCISETWAIFLHSFVILANIFLYLYHSVK